VRQSFRHLFFVAGLLPGAYGLVSACSLDLDESLIASRDADSGDAQSFGGFEADGSGWGDATTDGADASDDANDANDANDDATDGGNPDVGVLCDTQTCAPNTYCCFDGAAGGVCSADGTCSSVAIACDSMGDCGAGELCCLLDLSTVACANQCPSTALGTVQVCEQSGECAGGGMCIAPSAIIAGLLPPGYKTCE
jgi:hypothetical protein